MAVDLLRKAEQKRERFRHTRFRMNEILGELLLTERLYMEKIYFSPAEVAEILGVTRETIYNGIKSGDIPSYKIGRLRRISEEQIKEALRGFNATVI
jgi:excisionase family DNA binding protein